MEIKYCLCGCGKEVKTKQKYIYNHKINYISKEKFCLCGCGNKVNYKYEKGHYAKLYNPGKFKKPVIKKGVFLNCLQCNKEMYVIQSMKDRKKTCSNICAGEYRWSREEYRNKNIASHLGKTPWNSDKNHPKYQEYINKVSKPKTEEFCLNLKKIKLEQWKDKNSTYNSEKHQKFLKENNSLHTEEARKKHKKIIIEQYKNGRTSHRKGIKYEEEYGIEEAKIKKQKIRDKRAKQKFLKVSKLEKYFEQEMKKKEIEYETQVPLLNGKTIADFFIKPNFCVYVDGDYWHSLPTAIIKDKWVNENLPKNGYIVIRIKENQINKDIQNCINFVEHSIHREPLCYKGFREWMMESDLENMRNGK